MTENRVAHGRMTYTAANVLYLVERGYMAALWTSDPALYALGAQAAFDRLADPSAEVEMIGDATLFCKSKGATFSGWVVKGGPRNSDPIRYKSTALELLGEMVAEQFTARGAIAPPPVCDYGVTITASMRHYVADGAGNTSLCNRTMRHVINSAKYDPWSMVAGLPTCRSCANKAKAGGIVTRRRAAEILADAAVERLDAAHVEAGQVLAEVAPALAEAEADAAPAAGSHMYFTKAAEAAAQMAPALPEVDDSAPLGRRDLVTYNGGRYVIIRADSQAELTRNGGQVELYPGDALPDRIANHSRGHWVEASACARRLILVWGMRRRAADGGPIVLQAAGRAFAEYAVDVAHALGESSAELVARVPGGEWLLAPTRTPAERAAVAAVLGGVADD